MNDLITQKILSAADSITNVITAKAPAALQLILSVARIQALSNLIQAFIILAASPFFYIYYIKTWKWVITKGNEGEYGWDGEWIAFAIALALIGTIFSAFFIMALCCFFDIFNWIGIFHPDIYLAHQALDAIMNPATKN